MTPKILIPNLQINFHIKELFILIVNGREREIRKDY